MMQRMYLCIMNDSFNMTKVIVRYARYSYLRLRFHRNNAASAHYWSFVSSFCAYNVVVFVLHNVISRIPWTDVGVTIHPIARNYILIGK